MHYQENYIKKFILYGTAFFAAILGGFLYNSFLYAKHTSYVWFFSISLLLVLIYRIRSLRTPIVPKRMVWLSIPFAMTGVWYAFYYVFGEFDAYAILFHWQFGFGGAGVPAKYIGATVIISAITLCLLLLWILTTRRWSGAARFDSLAFLPLLVLNPLSLSMVDAFGLLGGEIPALANEYVAPIVERERDGNFPNVLHIYLESAERTFLENDYFAGVLDPLIAMENRGFVATNIQQVANTGWSIAGMVASTCGVPLIAPWIARKNDYSDGANFLPSAVCLPNVLRKRGYSTHFMKGADLKFGGVDTFLSTHGVESQSGVHDLLPQYPDQADEWGVKDGGLLHALESTFRELAGKDQPFYHSALTIGGHIPNGFLAKPCIEGSVELGALLNIARGVECTNRLVRLLLDRLEQDGLLENTIVILQSDHLSMKSEATRVLDIFDRRNFFLVFGPDINSKRVDRPASMMDVYPTLLHMLGLLPDHGRAGLGVSLLSGKPTLVEKWGEKTLSRSIKVDTALRQQLWLEREFAEIAPVTDNNLTGSLGRSISGWKLRQTLASPNS